MSFLYRYYDATGRLLYVGVAYDVPARLDQHRARSEWFDLAESVTVEFCGGQREAAEREAKDAARAALRLARERRRRDDQADAAGRLAAVLDSRRTAPADRPDRTEAAAA